MRPETVLVGDVTVVVVPGEDAAAIGAALSHASPGGTVVLAASEPDRAVAELGRYGGVVVDPAGHIARPVVGEPSPD